MRIVGLNPGHDGALASLANGRLEFSLEKEKDSRSRYAPLNLHDLGWMLERLPAVPDAVGVGGWWGTEPGYSGLDAPVVTPRRILGRKVDWICSTHERSHLFGAYAMSPFEPGRPCYALLWEGVFGTFYRIDEKMRITRFPTVLTCPGTRYAYLLFLADRSRRRFDEGLDLAGKLMALAAYGADTPWTERERAAAAFLFDRPQVSQGLVVNHKDLLPPDTPFLDIGVESPELRTFARKLSDEIFARFHAFATEHLQERLPLLIAGGCGLNCEWNTRWQESNLFADIFIPPCANDSGSAIGSAVEAQHLLTGQTKLAWSVASGEEFVEDWPHPPGWDASPLDLAAVAAHLAAGQVVAWAQGRWEIGPRALGHRSLLAAPFSRAATAELNRIKQRETYRPIAPVCLHEDVARHFTGPAESPFMLHFHRVTDPALQAVTHVDGSARVQTLRASDQPLLHALLLAFKHRTGTGVLCNTSLNVKNRGFINRTTDLMRFAIEKNIPVVVINDRLFVRTPASRPA